MPVQTVQPASAASSAAVSASHWRPGQWHPGQWRPHRAGAFSWLLPLLFLLLSGGGVAVAQDAGTLDPLERLGQWRSELGRAAEPSLEQLSQLQEILRDLRSLRRGEQGERAVKALLDLSVLGLRELPDTSPRSTRTQAGRLRRMAFDELRLRAEQADGKELLDRLITEVLIARRREPLLRRYAVLELIDAERTTTARVALLRMARDEEDPLRSRVLWTLASWPGEAVDLFLVSLLGQKWPTGERPHPFNLLLQRLRDEASPLGERAQIALEERVRLLLLSPDWRDASRGLELARGMDAMRQVPMLLDALSAWNRRQERGRGSLRITSDIQRELRRISGRTINDDARNWIAWWVAVRQGRIPLHAESQAGGAQRTDVGFFGLRPTSRAVTFVLDASGSMAQGWGTRGHSRYVEAINQMMSYLQAAGEDTLFNVVLFNSLPVSASSSMLPATAKNLERIRSSLLARQPEGNTNLRPAIELALGFEDGYDPEGVEVDTIVVLCDGETARGRRWVVPFIDRMRAEVRVIFHCVLLATEGDGALDALARETGGELLLVGG